MRSFLVAPFALFTLLVSTAAYGEAETPVHTIAVAGSAEMRVPAEFAVVSLGVVTQGTTVSETVADNSNRMTRVVEAVRKLGIPDADIKTVRFDISPRYAPQPQGVQYDYDVLRPTVGYSVSNEVAVTVRDMARVSDVVDRSIEAGANAAGGIDFDVTNTATLYDRARQAAIANAYHKAQVLAAATHLELERALSVTDNEASRTYDNRARGFSTAEVVVVTGSRLPATPILPGTVRIVSTVTVLYAVK